MVEVDDVVTDVAHSAPRTLAVPVLAHSSRILLRTSELRSEWGQSSSSSWDARCSSVGQPAPRLAPPASFFSLQPLLVHSRAPLVGCAAAWDGCLRLDAGGQLLAQMDLSH